MNEGIIPENMFKRSVLREFKTEDKDVITGAAFGKDCAILNLKEASDRMGVTQATANDKRDAALVVTKAVNSLAASGFLAKYVSISVCLPQSFEEDDLKILISDISSGCKENEVTVIGINTVTGGKEECIISVTAFGYAGNFDDETAGKEAVKPGDSIVVSKWIGIEGSLIILREKEEEIRKRYNKEFIRLFDGYSDYLSVASEAKVASASKVKEMKAVSEHGIFGALWELSEVTGLGLSVDAKAIPVRQEVIEICNLFDINPYEMKSSGMLIMVTKEPDALIEALKEDGIDASVIGSFSDNNDKTVLNGEEKRSLDQIKPDSIYKIRTVEGEKHAREHFESNRKKQQNRS